MSVVSHKIKLMKGKLMKKEKPEPMKVLVITWGVMSVLFFIAVALLH